MTKKSKVPELGPLEFALVRILWKLGSATAREVLDRYNAKRDKPLAYTTVMTLLTRLAEKGALSVDRSRQPFHFEPRISHEQLLQQRVQDFVDVFFDGRAVDLAVRLVEDRPLSGDSITRLEEILSRHRIEDAPDGEGQQ